MRKGIILAGGSGTRLYPVTVATSKQLLPVYDKPMIYYPLSVLMLAGITDILIITTPKDRTAFETLLGDGSSWGISLQYAEQRQPEGLAQAFIIGKEFVNEEPCALILGDNLYFGHGMTEQVQEAAKLQNGAIVFGYRVRDPKRYGVIEFNSFGKAISIEEKPVNPKSNYAVTGLYFYDHRACYFAEQLKPSKRGELEITDLNRKYLELEELQVSILGRGYAWLDTGTHTSLLHASQFVQTLEERQGTRIGCLEEVAFQMGYIDGEKLRMIIRQSNSSAYADYLKDLLEH